VADQVDLVQILCKLRRVDPEEGQEIITQAAPGGDILAQLNKDFPVRTIQQVAVAAPAERV
jgi:hypothetical protein